MKKLMITGGTGSFGSTLLKRILKEDEYDEIIVYSRDELKQDNLRKELSDSRLQFVVGDVRDRDRLFEVVKDVNHLFCAAALKQVPSCEFNPFEAVKTNIIGTKNSIDAAMNAGVESVVVLSTDKAVYPINAMGISKAMMEKIAIGSTTKNGSTKINVTRYGNVMGSRGSVIPFFIDRLKRNLLLPITHVEMTRFMMSLDESVDLVIHSLNSNSTGSTFVQKAPSADILTLVEALSILTKKVARTEVVGIRHGEKLHEALLSAEERAIAKETKQYFEVPRDFRDQNYLTPQSELASHTQSNLLPAFASDNASKLDAMELAEKIRKAGALDE